MTIEDIRSVALALPGAFEQASYGDRPSFRTTPRMFAFRSLVELADPWAAFCEELATN